MTGKLLLLCIISSLLLSCLTEDSGYSELVAPSRTTVAEGVPLAVAAGTGLPKVARIETVSFLDAKGQTVLSKQMHVGMEFTTCAGGWCQAKVDDCGIPSRIKYNFVTNGNTQKISFADVANAPAVQGWALEGAPFDLVRDGAAMNIACYSCPGTTQDGKQFTGRRVDFRVTAQ